MKILSIPLMKSPISLHTLTTPYSILNFSLHSIPFHSLPCCYVLGNAPGCCMYCVALVLYTVAYFKNDWAAFVFLAKTTLQPLITVESN